MKYLFFDIECSDSIHICEFGYVLTDEDFNIISKEDIIINPEANFNLDKKNGRTFALNYSEVVYYSALPFPHFFEKIQAILTSDDQLIVGHSVHNDATFIKTACLRYNLPFIDFSFYDSQIIYSEFSNLKDRLSLKKVSEDLNVEVSDKLHSGDEDALMTMGIIKGMCNELGCSLSELIELCPNCEGKSERGNVVASVTDYVDFLDFSIDTIESVSTRQKKLLISRLSNNLINTKPETNTLKGKSICFSANYEMDKFKETIALIEEVYRHGGQYTNRANEADYFIKYEEIDSDGNIKSCGRLKVVLNEMQFNGRYIKIIPIETFMSMLNIDEEYLYFKELPNKKMFKKIAIDKQDLGTHTTMTSNPFEELLKKKGLI